MVVQVIEHLTTEKNYPGSYPLFPLENTKNVAYVVQTLGCSMFRKRKYFKLIAISLQHQSWQHPHLQFFLLLLLLQSRLRKRRSVAVSQKIRPRNRPLLRHRLFRPRLSKLWPRVKLVGPITLSRRVELVQARGEARLQAPRASRLVNCQRMLMV